MRSIALGVVIRGYIFMCKTMHIEYDKDISNSLQLFDYHKLCLLDEYMKEYICSGVYMIIFVRVKPHQQAPI